MISDALRTVVKLRVLPLFGGKARLDRGRERYVRASLTASTAIISQGLAILISLLSVPLTIRYLGQERYGVWLTISSLLTWMTLTDFGLSGFALVNLVSEANGNDDRELARQYTASAFWAITAVMMVIGAVSVSVFGRVPWRAVFRVSAAVSTQEVQQACALTIAIVILSLPLNMLDSIYNAYQDGFIANGWAIVTNALVLGSLILVTQLRGGLPNLIFALSGTRVVIGIANAYYVFFCRYRWLAPGLSAVRWTRTKRLLKLGSKYMVTQLASLGIYQSQPMIITQLLGPSQVLIFAVALKVISLPNSLVWMATTPFLAAYSEAKARGDWNWIKGALKKSLVASLAIGVPLTIVIAFLAKPVIRLWAGAGAVPDSGLIVCLTVYTLLSVAVIPVVQMLCGLERVGALAVALSLCAVGTIGLSIPLAQWWGLTGVAVAMSAAVLFILGISQAYEAYRALHAPGIQAAGGEPLPEVFSV